MANGYGSLPSSSIKSNVDSQGKKAPPGFHYMPDGSLMSDEAHAKLSVNPSNEFHNWKKCSSQPSPNPWPGGSPKVWLDEANSYGQTMVPSGTPYGSPLIAAASTVLYNAYGSPNVGDVVKISTNHPKQFPMDWCLEYLGSTPTQQNPMTHWDVVSNAIYLSTSADCSTCSSTTSSAVYGCTDPTASNYNPLATIDDGSCATFGCMDSSSPNYNPLATVDDGTCFPCDCTYNGGFWCETHNHLPVAGYSPLPPVWIGTLSTLSNFIDSMWNGFTNNGCQYLENRILLWTSQLPNITNANHLTQKQGKIDWATAVLDNCDCNPTDFCYEIGDVGPGGGIVFSTPMTGGNSTSYYYEMHIEDLAYCSNNWSEITHLNPIIQPPNPMDMRCEEGIFDWSLWNAQQIPFAEWGGYNYNVGQLDVFPQYVGIGLANTTAQIASPSIQAVVFPSNETASSLCDNLTAFNAPNPTGFSDWYLPSAGEWELINQNIGPSTTFAAISNLEVSPNTGFGYPGVGPILEKYPRYYWTSSALINPLPTAPDTNHLQAYAYSISTSNTVPQGVVVADRCSALGVRAIRRFKCPTILPPQQPPRFYNYRDVYFGANMVKMPSITTPGMCNSGNMISAFAYNAWKNDVIGLNKFTIGLAATDVLGNTYNRHDFKMASNPSGYTITIWDNNKNYLGKWHYAGLEIYPQTPHLNLLSRPGMKRVVDQGGGVVQVLGDHFAGNSSNNSNITPELPRFINLRLINVTHLDGPNPLVRYGTNTPLTEAAAVSNGCALNNFNIDTETGCVGHQTSSYCFIKFECDATSGNQFENLDTGPNTDPQGSHVICTGKWINLFSNSPPGAFANAMAGTNLTPAAMNIYNESWTSGYGYGEHVRHLSGRLGVGTGLYANLPNGSWLASVSQTYAENPVYGTPNNWNEPQIPNLFLGQTWPLHYLHPWFASAPPSSSLTNNGITWYPDLQTAINTTAADQNGPCYTGNDSINIANS